MRIWNRARDESSVRLKPKDSARALETQNQTESSKYLLKRRSFPKESRAGRSVWYDRRLRNASSECSFSEKTVNWEDFEDFLFNKCSKKVMKDRLRYAKNYAHCLLNRDFSELNSYSECKRHHVLEGLSALAKFLGVYEVFKQLMKAYGLKWRTSNPEDLLITRMNKVGELGEVWIGLAKLMLDFQNLNVS